MSTADQIRDKYGPAQTTREAALYSELECDGNIIRNLRNVLTTYVDDMDRRLNALEHTAKTRGMLLDRLYEATGKVVEFPDTCTIEQAQAAVAAYDAVKLYDRAKVARSPHIVEGKLGDEIPTASFGNTTQDEFDAGFCDCGDVCERDEDHLDREPVLTTPPFAIMKAMADLILQDPDAPADLKDKAKAVIVHMDEINAVTGGRGDEAMRLYEAVLVEPTPTEPPVLDIEVVVQPGETHGDACVRALKAHGLNVPAALGEWMDSLVPASVNSAGEENPDFNPEADRSLKEPWRSAEYRRSPYREPANLDTLLDPRKYEREDITDRRVPRYTD